MCWESASERIQNNNQVSQSFKSNKRYLLEVIEYSSKAGLKSSDFEAAPLCNLRDALPEMKRAIRWKDNDNLAKLFKMAHELTNKELRLALHLPTFEEIPTVRVNGHYTLTVTPEQLERIKKNTILNFEFVEPVVEPAKTKNEKEVLTEVAGLVDTLLLDLLKKLG